MLLLWCTHFRAFKDVCLTVQDYRLIPSLLQLRAVPDFDRAQSRDQADLLLMYIASLSSISTLPSQDFLYRISKMPMCLFDALDTEPGVLLIIAWWESLPMSKRPGLLEVICPVIADEHLTLSAPVALMLSVLYAVCVACSSFPFLL